jgi:hypothetical protein
MEQTERANRAKEIYDKHKKQKLQEFVTKEFLQDYIELSYNCMSINNENIIRLRDSLHKIVNIVFTLEKQVKELTQQKERFQHNLMYIEVVEDIIISKETEWENKTFNNMLVKLVGKDEVYKVFVQTSNSPVIGSKIKFTFNADENKLSQLKLM